LALLLVGCDRAPIEQIGPDLRVVSPDLNRALSTGTLTLEVAAARGSDVQQVRVNGRETVRSGDVFSIRLSVDQVGVIPLEIVATSRSGAETTLSETALYLPYSYTARLLLEERAVGEHAAARVGAFDVLVTGGVRSPGEPAVRDAFVIGSLLDAVPAEPMAAPRAGHTLTPLPDGRVLVLGGATVAFPTDIDSLVSDVEVFDPATGTFSPVALDLRDPIQRAQHTTVAVPLPDGDTALYLTGGVGRAGTSGGEPFFGRISTVRRLRYEPGGPGDGGRLVQDSFDPRDGPRVEYLTQHAEAGVGGVPGVAAIVGAKDSLSGFVDASFRSSYGARSQDGRLVPLRPLESPTRLAHAGAPGLAGLAVFMGGRSSLDGPPLPSTEVYADGPRRRYLLPEQSDLLVPRWGHTATSVGEGRILVIGGFDDRGEPARAVELFGPR
jgi:hypothetical protein